MKVVWGFLLSYFILFVTFFLVFNFDMNIMTLSSLCYFDTLTWHTVSHLWLRYFVHFSHFTLPISTPTPGSWSTFAGQRGKPITHQYIEGFPDGSDSERVCLQCGRPGSIPWSGRSPGEGNGNPLQCSCLENPTDGGAWQATVPGVPRSPTRLSNFTFIFT